MSWLSGGELHSGAWTSSNYAGLGIPFENLPTTGENGGSPLLNDGGVPGDEVRWELLTVTGLTVDEFNEDGSFISTGTGSFTYRSYVNNVSVGDFTVTTESAGGEYTAGAPVDFSFSAAGGAGLTAGAGASVNLSALSSGGASLIISAGGSASFSASAVGGAIVFEPQTYDAGGAIIFDINASGGASGGIEPERDLPISDYGHNKQWNQSIFFRQFR